jgi:hypothetical protein
VVESTDCVQGDPEAIAEVRRSREVPSDPDVSSLWRTDGEAVQSMFQLPPLRVNGKAEHLATAPLVQQIRARSTLLSLLTTTNQNLCS